MKNDFKYKNWDLQNYIELERKAKKLTENDLENVSGGIMNKKLAASILMGLSGLKRLKSSRNFKVKLKIKTLTLK